MHRTFVATDVELYGDRARDDSARVAIRNVLFRLVDASLAIAGSPPRALLDTGDGAIAMVGADAKAAALAGIVGPLWAGLADHNRLASPEERLRLRVVVHAGEVSVDARGIPVGETIVHVCRLLDSQALRDRLRRSSDPLVLAVSDEIYSSLVWHRRSGLDRDRFTSVPVRVKETIARCWMYEPGGASGLLGQARAERWPGALDDLPVGSPAESGEALPPPVAPHARSLPLDALAWEDFERLCLELAAAPGDIAGCRRYGRPGEEQQGVDFYARDRRDPDRFRLYQCKRVRTLQPATIIAEARATLAHPFRARAVSYTLCTTDRVDSARQVKALETARDLLLTHNIAFDLWDRSELERKLRGEPAVVERFFGEAWAAAFCGRAPVAQLRSGPAPMSRTAHGAADALRRVLAVSEDTVSLSNAVARRAGSELRLGDGLYVTRTVERDLVHALRWMRPGPGPGVVVVGEAGMGKTSLLWRLRERLAGDGREVWLLPAGILLRGGGRNSADRNRPARGLDHKDVLAAAELVAARGEPPVVLLDTADLLLHHTEDRDELMELLGLLRQHGCPVVISSRPQEAEAVAGFKTVPLGPYDGSELPRALRRHILRFHGPGDDATIEQRRRMLMEGVASGLPIRTLCANPLTLRMLFEVAPERVTPEISPFALYDAYWQDRVFADRRGGLARTVDQPQNSDLSATTAAAGLVLLEAGVPELDEAALADDLVAFGGDPAQVPSLIGRGILRASSRWVSFFHQTFFEHAAARGLCGLGPDGIAAAAERIAATEGDLFMLPVHEQLLLLAEKAGRPVREAAEVALSGLLAGSSVAAEASAAYVYVHRRQVGAALTREVRARLGPDGKASFVDRVLDVAPNTVSRRLPGLLEELALVWRRGKRAEQYRVLQVLAELADRDRAGTQRLLIQEGCVESVLNDPTPEMPGVQSLLTVLFELAGNYPEYVFGQLAVVWRRTRSRARSRKVQLRIVEALHDRADRIGPGTLARRFETAIPDWPEDVRSEMEALSRAVGRLLASEWLARRRDTGSILAELSRFEPGTLPANARLNGLAEVLLRNDDDLLTLLAAFEHEDDRRARSLIARIVFSALLRGTTDPSVRAEAAARDVDDPPGIADDEHGVQYDRPSDGDRTPGVLPTITLAMRAWARDRLREAGTNEAAWATGTAGLLLDALQHAQLPPAALSELLRGLPITGDMRGWTKHLAAFVLPMALAGDTEATRVLDRIRRSPLAVSPATRHRVLTSLLAAWDETPLAELAAVDVCVHGRDPGELDQLLTRLERDRDRLNLWRPILAQTAMELALDRSTIRRSVAVNVWRRLVELGMAPEPTVEQLTELLIRRRSEDMVAALRMAETCLLGGLLPVAAMDRLRDAVRPLIADAPGPREHLARCETVSAIAQTVWEDREPSRAMVESAVEMAFTAPINADRIVLLGKLLDHLSATDPFLGADLALAVGTRLRETGRSHTPKNVANRLRRPLQRLFAVAPADVASRLLTAIPDLHPVFGEFVVQAAVLDGVGEATAVHLDELLMLDSTPSGVKESIRRIKYYRQRLHGGQPWPELRDLTRYEIHDLRGHEA